MSNQNLEELKDNSISYIEGSLSQGQHIMSIESQSSYQSRVLESSLGSNSNQMKELEEFINNLQAQKEKMVLKINEIFDKQIQAIKQEIQNNFSSINSMIQYQSNQSLQNLSLNNPIFQQEQIRFQIKPEYEAFQNKIQTLQEVLNQIYESGIRQNINYVGQNDKPQDFQLVLFIVRLPFNIQNHEAGQKILVTKLGIPGEPNEKKGYIIGGRKTQEFEDVDIQFKEQIFENKHFQIQYFNGF